MVPGSKIDLAEPFDSLEDYSRTCNLVQRIKKDGVNRMRLIAMDHLFNTLH